MRTSSRPGCPVRWCWVLAVFWVIPSACGDQGPGAKSAHALPEGMADLVLEVAIGEEPDAPAEYQFSMILDLVASADGTIWVLDGDAGIGGGQTPLLRRFDSGGRFLGQVGRVGSGPGEYRAPNALALLRDGRVALRDPVLAHRLTLYSPQGRLDTTWSFPTGLFSRRRLGWGIEEDEGGLLWVRVSKSPRPTPGDTFSLVRLHPDGTLLDTVPFPEIHVELGGPVRVTRTTSSGGQEVFNIGNIPYQARGSWTWCPFGGGFAVARTGEYRIEILPPLGEEELLKGMSGTTGASVLREIERELPPVPVQEAERRALQQEWVEDVARLEARTGVRVPVSEVPSLKPPVRSLDCADDGQLLVTVSVPSVRREGTWKEPTALDVFDTNGEFRGRIVLPESFFLLRMRGDHIWGVFSGPYGVQSVRRYRIAWPRLVPRS